MVSILDAIRYSRIVNRDRVIPPRSAPQAPPHSFNSTFPYGSLIHSTSFDTCTLYTPRDTWLQAIHTICTQPPCIISISRAPHRDGRPQPPCGNAARQKKATAYTNRLNKPDFCLSHTELQVDEPEHPIESLKPSWPRYWAVSLSLQCGYSLPRSSGSSQRFPFAWCFFHAMPCQVPLYHSFLLFHLSNQDESFAP